MAHTLYICGLPIGDLDDITVRVLACLRSVSAIFSEDTRVTRILLNQLSANLGQGLNRMDAFQEKRSLAAFDAAILKGDVAYVTDAGSPGISDPGAVLVAHARKAGIAVKVCPGPSAVSAFVSGCGVAFNSFYFGGFLPKKECAMRSEIDGHIYRRQVSIWFESPRRIEGVMSYLNDVWPTLFVVVAKEITKPHERFFYGEASHVYSDIIRADLRGEWIFLVDSRAQTIPLNYIEIARACKDAGLSARQVKALAGWFNCKKNELYDTFQHV
jgi:16S rRNA (cytidine1402-2'-O)-methyltransferase